MICPSDPKEARAFPLGDQARDVVHSRCPCRSRISFPLDASQRRTQLSTTELVASHSPWGDQASASTTGPAKSSRESADPDFRDDNCPARLPAMSVSSRGDQATTEDLPSVFPSKVSTS